MVNLSGAISLIGGFPALAGVDLTVGDGEIVVLRGPNGAGKSTLLRLCAGLAPLNGGQGRILGRDLSSREQRRQIRRETGLLAHQTFLYDELTVEDNLAILQRHTPWSDKKSMWRRAENEHRSKFTQVREIELSKASIRLPQGRLYVSVLTPNQFDQIEEQIPDCVQTRLNEFMDGPAERLNAKVYYLKPLCVEVDSELIFTTQDELQSAIEEVREEVFQEVRRKYIRRIPRRVAAAIVNGATAVPRSLVRSHLNRRKKKIDDYQAKLEFERRMTAREAMLLHRECRTHGCSYDQMLELTNPLETEDVVNQYAVENELSEKKKDDMLRIAVGSLPWFFRRVAGNDQGGINHNFAHRGVDGAGCRL